MMENNGKKAIILYEMALAVGGELEVERVLHKALAAFVRGFGCAGGAIYLASPDIVPDEPAVAFPDGGTLNTAVQLAGALLPPQLTQEQWRSFCAALPQWGSAPECGSYCLLPIGTEGLLVLTGPDALLDAETVGAMIPLMTKLHQALDVCWRHERLAAAHRTALLEGNLLRTVFDATPTVLFAIDKQGRTIFSEGCCLETIGCEPGEVVGRSVFDVFRDVPEIVESIEAALAGEPRSITLQVDDRSWDATCEPIRGESGSVSCVVGVAHDVTERTAAIDSLSAVLQTVGEGILSLDAEGRITLVNAELEATFGYTAQELLGQPIRLLLPEFGAQASPPARADVPWRIGLGQRRELGGRRKDGTAFPVEVCINEIASGGPLRYTGSLRDITERKEYDRLRDEFVSTVSHELRTPLTSIMGWTETLLTEHPGPINEGQRRFLNIVYASSQRLNRLIEEILTVSRIQRGTLRINPDIFQPAQLLETVRESVTSAAERQGIRLHFEDNWPPAQSVPGDPQLIEQVISNLISNAVKFSRQGSDVRVRSLRTTAGWRVEVEDHGMGLPASDLPKLFQRFVRGSNAKEAHIQGAGLGLFVSKAIVEGHGGQIHLASREGEGTTAWFDLPQRQAEQD